MINPCQVKSTQLLGVTLTADLKWQSHIDKITAKASQRLYCIILLNRAGVESQHLVNIYTSLVRSVVEYACQVWHTNLTKQQTKQLESIQRRAMRTFRNVLEAIVTAGIPTLADRRETLCRTLFAKRQKHNHKLHHLLPPVRETTHSMRSNCKCTVPRCRTERFKNSFIPYALYHWQ